MKLNEEQAEAVVRLQNSQDFKLLVEAINVYRHEVIEMVMMGPEDGVSTYRGMARATTEVLRALGGARDILVNYRNRK